MNALDAYWCTKLLLEQHGSGVELQAAMRADAFEAPFPGITDNAHAQTCVRSIVGCKPLPSAPRTVTRLCPAKRG